MKTEPQIDPNSAQHPIRSRRLRIVIVIVGIALLIPAAIYVHQKYSKHLIISNNLALGASHIPAGANDEYAKMMDRARTLCGADVSLFATEELWESAVNHIVDYYLSDTTKCHRQKITYWVDTDSISDLQSGGPGPFPYYDPIPLADWNISSRKAWSIAGFTQENKPHTSLLNRAGQFYWLVDSMKVPSVNRYRIDAKTGKVLEHRNFVLTE